MIHFNMYEQKITFVVQERNRILAYSKVQWCGPRVIQFKQVGNYLIAEPESNIITGNHSTSYSTAK